MDKIGYYTATLNEKQGHYKEGSNVNMRTQGIYYELNESYQTDVPRFVKQWSDKWFELPKKAKVTGSTMHSALGLETLKRQQEHFDQVIHGKTRKSPSEQQQTNMEFGTKNEINATPTLACKIMPVYFPDLSYVEEGCYLLNEQGSDFMVVSPDGSLRKTVTADAAHGFEAKCKTPNQYVLPVYYNIPHYYVLQTMSEMKALNVDNLIFCWSPESTVCMKIRYDDRLWQKCNSCLLELYGTEVPKIPKRKQEYIKEIKIMIQDTLRDNVKLIGEFPSVNTEVTSALTTSIK